ncbi:iron-siderophore ABC transporter substrate-binding protein [Salinivibrio socompensis]|uniref:iron-siderophore ABC transporter substrate-binding protein n=1 Tax=Salinivibrio socompensis TaxID=1510206 RepID=UPI0004B13225|nr:iron-siderophore ABC transporter substrate-binding protein [Salinivibrio socompensis]
MIKSYCLVLVVWLLSTVMPASATEPPRILSLDWTQTETLLALGVTPVAVAQKADYNAWVRAPLIPEKTVDIGLRTQPNMERLAELAPDKILISPIFKAMKPKLSTIAPVSSIPLYEEGLSWVSLKTVTRQIASEAKRPDAGEALIASAQQQLTRLRQTLSSDQPPLLMIQFLDPNHVRVFGTNSLYHAAISELGLNNAWQNKTNSWGFSMVSTRELLDLDAQLVIVRPLPAGVELTSRPICFGNIWLNARDIRR